MIYAIYLALTCSAIFMTWPSAAATNLRGERQIVAILMALLPVCAAVGLTIGLRRDIFWAPGLFGAFFGGLLILAVGLLFSRRLPGHSALAWRLLGWSAATSVLLIPATTAGFAWIGGLLAFLIPWPEGWMSNKHPSSVLRRGQG